MPVQYQAIPWNSGGLLLITPLTKIVNEILIAIQSFSLKKMHWNITKKFQRNFDQNSNFFIEEYVFKHVVCQTVAILSCPECINLEWYPSPLQDLSAIYPRVLISQWSGWVVPQGNSLSLRILTLTLLNVDMTKLICMKWPLWLWRNYVVELEQWQDGSEEMEVCSAQVNFKKKER